MGSPGAGYGSDVVAGVGEGAGLSALGYGLSMNPQLNLTNPMTELTPDQAAIQAQMGTQQGITQQGLNQQQGINQQGMGQQMGLLGSAMGAQGNIANNEMQTLTSQLSPTGQLGQQLAGEYNNYGITPNSGAFQQGLANQYGNLAMQNDQSMSSLLGQGYGNLAGQSGTGTAALTNLANQGTQTQSGLGQTGLQNTLGLESQGVNTQNAQSLAQFMQQAGLQSALVGGGLNTTGQASQGGATSGTWICTAMRQEHILASCEVKRLHDHLFLAFWSRPWKFIGYFIFGKLAVWLARSQRIDLSDWRSLFYDRVISEDDPVKAVDLYEQSFWMLVKEIKHRLRIKTLIIYDEPRY